MPAKKVHFFKTSAISMAILLTFNVGAQDTDYSIEKIEVTASKRVESMQDVPVAISALNENMLEVTGVDTVTDVIPMVPGLTGQTYGLTTNTWAIRGISTNDWTAGSEPSVGVYFDEAYIGRNALATGAFFDIGRIEVIKGPQGTLFGRNASAGAISIISNKPEDETVFSAGLMLGNEGQQKYNLMANLAISDEFSVRGAYYGTRLEGVWTDVEQNEEGYTDADNIRLMAQWRPSDDFEALLTLNYSDAEGNMGGAYNVATSTVAPGEEFPDKIARSQLERESVESNGTNLNMTWYLSDNITLTSITDLRSYDSSYSQDIDATANDELIDSIVHIIQGGDGSGITGGMTLEYQTAYSNQESIAQEFRVNGTGDNYDWFVGASYFNENIDEQLQVNLHETALGWGQIAQDVTTTKGETESVGIYGDLKWLVNDNLTLTSGIRWSQDKKDWCTQSNIELGFQGDNIGTAGNILCDEAKWSEVTPRLVLDYRLNGDTIVYTSVSKGYKGGGFNSTAVDSDGDFVGDSVVAFDPEINTAYELGIKSTLLDDRMRINAATYFSDYQDLQVQSESIAGIFIANAASAETKGVELELTYMATPDLTLTANYAFLDAEFTEGELTGNLLTYAPESSYSVSVNYITEFSMGMLNWFAMYNWQDDFYFDTANSLMEESYGLLSGKVTFTPTSESWDFSISADNITDEAYANYRQDLGLGIGVSVNRGMPRLIRAEVNYYF